MRAIVLESGNARAALIGADQSSVTHTHSAWGPGDQPFRRFGQAGGANSGYVPSDTAFGAYTFQVLGSRLKPGCAEDGIVNGVVDLIQASGR